MEPTKPVAKQSSCCWIPLGALSGLVCVPTQHFQATIGESSVSRHLHTRIAARVCETSGQAAENRATLWSQRSPLRNSLPVVGFRWGHCQVLFVSQHNIFKQPLANPVSHDTCTRELPPEFVKRAAKQLKIEQHYGANEARCETVFLLLDSVGGTVRSCLCPNTTFSSNHWRIQCLTTLAHANCRQSL